jgi:hypothetical protein
MRTVTILLLVAATTFGCKKHEATPANGSGAAPGSAMAASGSGMAHHAGNCPSTVALSATSVGMEGSNVLVTITSDDKGAVDAIQKRTDELLDGRKGHKADAAGTQHMHNGEHGGGIGLCPVYIPDTATATSSHLANGVTITITSPDASALKTEIDARIQRAADWVKANVPPGVQGTQGAVGGGKNNEGMNHSGLGDGKGLERKANGSGSGAGSGSGSATR